jgi:ribonuclease BN (tRNA processing enzyme)
MNLTVLGGSHAAVNTGAGSSGYLVTHGETRVLVDPGPNTIAELRKHADHRTLSAVVITHMHADHILDLITLRLAIRYNPVKANRITPVFLPPGGKATLLAIVEPMRVQDGYDDYFADFDLQEYDPATSLNLGEMTITFAPTVHAIPGWAMRFAAADGSGSIVFTSDTGPHAQLDEFAADADILLSEASYGVDPTVERRRDIRFHMTAGEAIALANRTGARILVLTHTTEELDPDAIAAAMTALFSGPSHIATPGLVVHVTDT